MKTIQNLTKSAALAILLSVSAVQSLNAEPSLPSDTNPALLYWREFATLPEVESDQLEKLSKQGEIDSPFRGYVGRFDNTFRRLEKVQRLTAPCNWGDDLDEGPGLLLPYLSKARDIARMARLRVRSHLNDGNEAAAVNELLSVYTLGGHVASSPILINLMVRYAIDRISATAIAESLGQFSDSSLRRLREGILEAPTGLDIADTINTERQFMAGWIRTRLQKILDENPSNKGAAKTAAGALMETMLTNPDDENVWQVFEKTGVSDVEGIIRLLDQTNKDYDRLESLCRMPRAKHMDELEAFDEATRNSPNAIRRQVFPLISKAVARALGSDVIRSMVITAIDTKMKGPDAVSTSTDPVGGAPFQHKPFRHGTSVVGFTLESALNDERDRRFLFLTKPVAGMQVSGPELGTIQ